MKIPITGLKCASLPEEILSIRTFTGLASVVSAVTHLSSGVFSI